MNPTKPNGTNGEQYDEQHSSQQSQQNGQQRGMEAPVSSTRGDVMKAEQKAEEARSEAKDAKRMTVEEVESLRRDVQQLEEVLEKTREELQVMDRVVNGLFDHAATPEGEAPLNSDMPYCCEENREDELSVEEAMTTAAEEGGSDA